MSAGINRTFQSMSQRAASNTTSFMKPSSMPLLKKSSHPLFCFSKALWPSVRARTSPLNLSWSIYAYFISLHFIFFYPPTTMPRPLNVVTDQASAPNPPGFLLWAGLRTPSFLPGLYALKSPIHTLFQWFVYVAVSSIRLQIPWG